MAPRFTTSGTAGPPLYAHECHERIEAQPFRWMDGEVIGVLVNRHLARVGEFEQKVAVGLDFRLFLNACEIDSLHSVVGPQPSSSVRSAPGIPE